MTAPEQMTVTNIKRSRTNRPPTYTVSREYPRAHSDDQNLSQGQQHNTRSSKVDTDLTARPIIMDFIELSIETDPLLSNPTSQQKAIYNHHEKRLSDEAGGIYSVEWYDRTISFVHDVEVLNARPTRLDSWPAIEKLDFGPFFLAHPISGYSLWLMRQAFYRSDYTVCVKPWDRDEMNMVLGWRSRKPFEYFVAKDVREKWRRSLKVLKKEIECKDLDGQALVTKLYDIHVVLRRLETAFEALEQSFSETLQDLQFVDKMLATIKNAVEQRRKMVAVILSMDEGTHISDSEPAEEKGGYEDEEFDSDNEAMSKDPNPTKKISADHL